MQVMQASAERRRRSDRVKALLLTGFLAAGSLLVYRAASDYFKAERQYRRVEAIKPKLNALAKLLLVQEVVVDCANIIEGNSRDASRPGVPDYEISGVHRRLEDGSSEIYIDHFYCVAMSSLADSSDPSPSPELRYEGAVGVLVVGHEYAHGEGEYDEGRANCRAVELFPRVAESLGLSEFLGDTNAMSLARSLPQPKAYHSAGC
jgi:hypothetical protein